MKRIGIITFFSNCNYGSVLQAYALSQYLINKGYDARIIDYTNLKNYFNLYMKTRTLANRLLTSIKAPSIWKRVLHGKCSSIVSVKALNDESVELYDDFVRQKLNPYKGSYHHKSDFDAFICGSDQIWQVSVPGLSDVFFLRFTEKKKRIAYAASLGSVTIPKFNVKRFKRYIKGFSSISVRENKSKQLIREYCNQESVHVLDPSLLVGKEFWLAATYNYTKREKYILCYFLDECSSIESIIALARKNSLNVIWIETAAEIPNSAVGIRPSPIEFVSLIENANYVFTDSFHACCFSSIFERNFYVVKRNYKGYSAQHIRIQELLKVLQMEDRHVNSCLNIEILEPILYDRYEQAHKRIAKLRSRSELYLEDALSNV